ncbi:hypothetical protein C8J57DRAFT_1709318 [Mycena rebaudengoi]|nr:hypothetical protein C8J57DRAFT_1709318 [Mycena rebaudengoi]
MVFGLFTRKPNNPQLPSTTDSLQLRTPSPSIIEGSSSPRVDDLLPPITPSPPPQDVTDPAALRALIQSVPPKILHTYALAHLATASPQTLTYLSAFFSALEPPPQLHCVRCHAGYFDVENTDQSCRVNHDDDSAEVERGGTVGYETLWGCCGKTVEGDGDMGPPDGWCYEGMHTTDTKRARFRADSTLHDDKLTSCARLRCHNPDARPSRKRTRAAAKGADSGADDSDTDDEDVSSHSSVRTRSRTSKKARTAKSAYDSDDVDMDERSRPSSSLHTSPKSPARARAKPVSSRPKPAAKAKRAKTPAAASDPPSPSKKPPSTRFAPSVATVAAAASFSSTATNTTATQQIQTFSVVVTPPDKKVKRAMKPKSQAKPRQAKRLDEVVDSSIVGEV